ncbi:MAG: aminopeptidase P family protein [Verrucomicrobia bacterium]|nr:aminopeptidase P family protein [Verrucomicrobiota bacterium]
MTRRSDRIASSLEQVGLDGVLSFLPENILFFSGYWPSTGDSVLVLSRKGTGALIYPSVDQQFIPENWKGITIPYDVDPIDIVSGGPRTKVIQAVRAVLGELGLSVGRLGCELAFETLAGAFRGSEANTPAQPIFEAVREAVPRIQLSDYSTGIRDLRKIKNNEEVASLKRCNEIAGHAFGHAKELIEPGMSEIGVASALESAFQQAAVAHRKMSRARGYAFAMSGPVNSTNAWLPANFSTDRTLQNGDSVLIEFNGYVDGFWCDLSRTTIVGEPSRELARMTSGVSEALQEVISRLEPGLPAGQADRLARASFRSYGLEQHFKHYIGHGVGFAFHEPPILRSDSAELLEPGMVLALEPGVYIDKVGGVRIEENVVITEEGAVLLSAFDRST